MVHPVQRATASELREGTCDPPSAISPLSRFIPISSRARKQSRTCVPTKGRGRRESKGRGRIEERTRSAKQVGHAFGRDYSRRDLHAKCNRVVCMPARSRDSSGFVYRSKYKIRASTRAAPIPNDEYLTLRPGEIAESCERRYLSLGCASGSRSRARRPTIPKRCDKSIHDCNVSTFSEAGIAFDDSEERATRN